MSVQIVLNGFTAPVTLNGGGGSLLDYLADYYFLYGGDQSASTLNRAPRKPLQGQFVGLPTVAANYARFGQTDYFRTAGGMGGSLTFLAVIRKVGTTRANFGNYSSGTSTGVLAYMQSGSEFWAGTNGSFNAKIAFTPDDKWYAIAVTFDGTATRLYIFTGGAVAFSATEAKTTTLAAAPFKIGGFAGLGDTDAAAAVAYPVVLTQAELLGVVQKLSTVLSPRGIALA